MLKMRRSRNRLIFNMGIPIPGKDCLYIETGPCYLQAGVLDTLTEMPQESPPLSPVACSPPPPLPVSTPRIIFTPEEQFEKMRDEIDHERQKSPVTSPRLARRRQVKSEADLPAYVPLTRLNRKPSKDAENSSRNTPNKTFKSSITFSNGDPIPESPPMARRTEDRVSSTPSPKPVSFDSPPMRQKSLDVSPTRMSYDSPPMRQRSLKTQNAFGSPPTRPKSFTSSQSLDRPLLKPKPRDISPSQPSRTRPAVRPKSFHASSIQNGDHSTNPNIYDSPPMRRKTCTDATPVEKPYDSPPRRQKSYETSVKKTPNGTSPSPERSFGTLRTAMSLGSLPTKDPINSDTSPGLRNGNKQNSYDMYLTSPGNHEATSPRSLKLDLGSLSPRSLDDPPVRKRSPRSRPSGGSKVRTVECDQDIINYRKSSFQLKTSAQIVLDTDICYLCHYQLTPAYTWCYVSNLKIYVIFPCSRQFCTQPLWCNMSLSFCNHSTIVL